MKTSNALYQKWKLSRLFTVTRVFVYSGSSNALWFSSKFERKMAAFDEDAPASPMTRFQRAVPIRESKINGGKNKQFMIICFYSSRLYTKQKFADCPQVFSEVLCLLSTGDGWGKIESLQVVLKIEMMNVFQIYYILLSCQFSILVHNW